MTTDPNVAAALAVVGTAQKDLADAIARLPALRGTSKSTVVSDVQDAQAKLAAAVTALGKIVPISGLPGKRLSLTLTKNGATWVPNLVWSS